MFWFSIQILSEIFLSLKRNELVRLKYVYKYLCKVLLIIVRFEINLNYLHRFSKNTQNTSLNQKVNAIFTLHGNQDREELPHCAVLTAPVEEFSHVQYSALPSVEWQQWGRKYGLSFVRLHHRRTTWRSAVSLGRRSETCGNSVWTEHHESTKGLWVDGKV